MVELTRVTDDNGASGLELVERRRHVFKVFLGGLHRRGMEWIQKEKKEEKSGGSAVFRWRGPGA